MQRKVLVTSGSFGEVSGDPLEILLENGMQVDFENGTYNEEKFIDIISRYDALIIGAHEFSAKTMEKAKKLRIICKHGAGVDNIDLNAAREYNICVTNVPSTNSNAVADMAFGLILDVARKISLSARLVKNGLWERKKNIGVDVYRKTLSLIGFGAIARNMAKRAAGFGMEVCAYDPYVKELPKEFSRVKLISFEEAITKADFLSIHIPLNEKTRNFIGSEQMVMMKKGSFLINTSRGGIVNEEALYEYLANNHLAGAGLDVTEKEPPAGSPLLELDSVTIVPHIASYSKESLNAVSLVCAKNVVKFFNGEEVDNIVAEMI